MPDLDSLGDRIRRARNAERKKDLAPVRDRASLSAAALAWRMFADLLAGILVGFGLGWGVDTLFGTAPLFLVIIGLLGMAGGIRLAMRTAKEVEKMEDNGKVG